MMDLEKGTEQTVIGRQKDIKSDVEYVKNQLDYLEQYQVRISDESTGLNSFSVKWNGPQEQELIYKEIDRWLKCYNQLGEHLKIKDIPDDQIKLLQADWVPSNFEKPTSYEKDAVVGFKRFAYTVFPFYRIAYNKEKSKLIKEQVVGFSYFVGLLRKLAYKVEAFYMDGV
jgi:hypothetical protein